MKVKDVLALGRGYLSDAGIDGAARDARWLMAAALDVQRDRLTLCLGDEIGEDAKAQFLEFAGARTTGKPVSLILGGRNFYGRWFMVTKDVLDPRPETEELVALALEELFSNVLDLGTGNGCILISLLSERGEASGIGIDKSALALAVAARNATDLGVSGRITFTESNWFDAVTGQFDLVVSNPPYIAIDEMPGLQPEVRKYDPHLALTDGGDGLGAYRSICAGAMAHLLPGGRLLVEIGPTQAGAVQALFEQAGLANIEIRHDLDGRDRVVIGRRVVDNTGLIAAIGP